MPIPQRRHCRVSRSAATSTRRSRARRNGGVHQAAAPSHGHVPERGNRLGVAGWHGL